MRWNLRNKKGKKKKKKKMKFRSLLVGRTSSSAGHTYSPSSAAHSLPAYKCLRTNMPNSLISLMNFF